LYVHLQVTFICSSAVNVLALLRVWYSYQWSQYEYHGHCTTSTPHVVSEKKKKGTEKENRWFMWGVFHRSFIGCSKLNIVLA
jgi:hypothetical protein